MKKLAFALLSLLALTPALALAQVQESPKIDDKVKQEVILDLTNVLEHIAFVPGVDFEKWNQILENNKADIDKAENNDEFARAINKAFQEFGFSHIVLFSPTMAERRTTNKMVGLGIRIQVEEKGVRVVRVFEDGGAFAAGLKSGDLIIEADGKPLTSPASLAGEEGKPVELKIDRNGVIIEREVVRKSFAMVIPEELSWPDPQTAVLTVPSFDQEYNEERVQGLMTKAMDAKNIIVDLRGNGGGRVINLLHFAAFFLNRDDVLGSFVDRSGLEKYIEETGEKSPDLLTVAQWTKNKVRPMRRNKEPFAGNVVVLIDGATGSASEMIAAALKDYRGAKIVGSKSAGAVLASTLRPLSEGFLIQFPLMDYVTVKGVRLEGNGIEPDVEAPSPRFGEVDKGVQEALKILADVKIGLVA